MLIASTSIHCYTSLPIKQSPYSGAMLRGKSWIWIRNSAGPPLWFWQTFASCCILGNIIKMISNFILEAIEATKVEYFLKSLKKTSKISKLVSYEHQCIFLNCEFVINHCWEFWKSIHRVINCICNAYFWKRTQMQNMLKVPLNH